MIIVIVVITAVETRRCGSEMGIPGITDRNDMSALIGPFVGPSAVLDLGPGPCPSWTLGK